MTEPLPNPLPPCSGAKGDLESLLNALRPQQPARPSFTDSIWTLSDQPTALRYANTDPERGIDFSVEDNPFLGAQVLDPRLVRIAPGASNEKHRHAHESLFLVMKGVAEIQIGVTTQALQPGMVAFVPRWVVHQTHNPSQETPLLMLAITDFGLTATVLGDYDSSTRLKLKRGSLQ